MPSLTSSYAATRAFDELITPNGRPRAAARILVRYLNHLGMEDLRTRKQVADLAIKTMGITFTVYSEGENIDREWPYDIIPRIIPEKEWEHVRRGLVQRLHALNNFINDVYNDKCIVRDGVVPAEVLQDSRNYRRQCEGLNPVYGVWAHICGSDLVRDSDGTIYVLEDNLRVPSGVSYMLENRKVTKRVFPELFEDYRILPVGDYPGMLFDTLASISPRPMDFPEVVALANAPGAGVADDKVIYTYVPAMIKYYLDEEPILPNVPSYVCADEKQRRHVLANLRDLVVKSRGPASRTCR